jgi:hypothetical protein
MLKKSPKKKPVPPARRMSAYRARLRKQGLKPVQLWLYDAKSKAFRDEIRRQCLAIAKDDPAGREMDTWIEATYEWPDP